MQLFNTAEAAELLGVSACRVQQFVKDGRLVPTRRDPYIFTLDALRELMKVWVPGRCGRPPPLVPPAVGASASAEVPTG